MSADTRYARQMLLPGVGEEGQALLGQSHACVIGVGALGCQIADLLARAGVGFISLFDRDIVEATNLQRQCLFTEADAREATPKAVAAEHRLRAINSSITVRGFAADIHHKNAEKLLLRGEFGPPGVLLDGTDNFETRYLLNDLAVKHALPLVYGGVIATRGMQASFVPGGPCLRCVFEEIPAPGSQPTCDTAGVLGPAAAIIGATQATDALKILLGKPELLSGTLLEFDLWSNQRRRVDLSKFGPRADCPCCGLRRFEFLERPAGATPPTLCGRNAVQVFPAETTEPRGTIDLTLVAARWSNAGACRVTQHTARLVPADSKGVEITLFADGRAIVQGTTDHALARSLYARYVGA